MVGAGKPVVDDVAALRDRALDERRGQRRRRQPHVARHGKAARPEVGDKGASELAEQILGDLLRIEPANVVGLEDVGIDR